ncbi:TPR-like protein [Violaceomyces palustris]|uniref:TPR-like protein n=1 Tax=Violaceomyces palustris TaxID=1673888 RepID=A0ACD0NWM5_9BASI|nr:TPR-like protein [Violaceomyces palustris]
MSLSDLVSGGAGCGPSNPLQNIGKRFGQDRSSQLDNFTHDVPSSSSASRSFRSTDRQLQQQQQQPNPDFFQHQQPHHSVHHFQGVANDTFDLASLRSNLPFSQSKNLPQKQLNQAAINHNFEASFRPPPALQRPVTASQPPAAVPAWAADFLQMGGPQSTAVSSPVQRNQGVASPAAYYHAPQTAYNAGMGMGMGMGVGMGMGMSAGIGPAVGLNGRASFNEHQNSSIVQKQHQAGSLAQVDKTRWETAFTAYDSAPPRATTPPTTSAQQVNKTEALDHSDPFEKDELARTAGRLVSTVEHDQSLKFRQSNFLDLMRRIRDKQAGIQGTDIVDSGTAISNVPVLDKGKGKAREAGQEHRAPQSQQEAYAWANQMASRGQASQLPPSMQRSLGTTSSNVSRGAGIPSTLPLEHEIHGRQELNDLWAEEDARSAAIEREAMMRDAQTFSGDGGDVATRMREDEAEAREFEKYQSLGANVPHASMFDKNWEEKLDDDLNDDTDFVGRAWEGTRGQGMKSAQAAEWDTLQNDWDDFEVTSAGMRENAAYRAYQRSRSSSMRASAAPESAKYAPAYRFLSENPYVSTRQHAAHSGGLPAGLESVLEREAAVQANPTSASAWYDLGVKQQENERESQAIAALQKAVALDPTLKDAWLALAVSYTNENDRPAAYEAIERWIGASDRYRDVAARFDSEYSIANETKSQVSTASSTSASTSPSIHERHSKLTGLLIALARHGSEVLGEVDADVQVALGVLFNGSEDYDKAVDCFSAALSVRPEDWLLYNRLGATLSNSGRSAEAISFYHHALSLQPEFVRCHFNLSISCLNLKMYQDAVEHLFTALTLQQAESDSLPSHPELRPNNNATNNSLWETFRVALELLNRPDLAAKCVTRDINNFDHLDLVAPGSGQGFNVGGGGGASGENHVLQNAHDDMFD